MGSRIECFWLEPTERAQQSLRRFYYSASCNRPEQERMCAAAAGEGCDASVDIGEIPYPFFKDGRWGQGMDDYPHDDPSWPKVCAKCGVPFDERAIWQNNWLVDAPSKQGSPWTREGKPPKVTARPSILTSRYHGFLTDGFLVEC